MNEWERNSRMAKRYKESYPPGTRIMLLSMDDPYAPVPEGIIMLAAVTGMRSCDIADLRLKDIDWANGERCWGSAEGLYSLWTKESFL